MLWASGCGFISRLMPIPSAGLAQEEKEPFRLFPNPCRGRAWLNLEGLQDQPASIRVYGQPAGGAAWSWDGLLESTVLPLNLEGLPNGLYFLHVAAEGRKEVQKLVVAR